MVSVKKSLSYAIVLHVAVLSFLLIELRHSATELPSKPSAIVSKSQQTPVIHAVAVNQQQVEKQVALLKQQDLQRQAEQRQQQAEQRQQLAKVQQAAAAAKQQQQEALKQLTQLKEQQAFAEKQQQQRLAQLKEEQAQAQKKLQQLQKTAKAQQKPQKQQTVLAQQQPAKLAPQKKNITPDAAQEKQLQAEAQKLLQQQLASEQQQLNAAKQRAIDSQLARYTMLIKQSISDHWNVPQNIAPNLSCVLLIRLSDHGNVLAVKLMKTSGDPVLDRSAEAAVYKASPLPVPDNPETMQMLREIRLTVTPTQDSNIG